MNCKHCGETLETRGDNSESMSARGQAGRCARDSRHQSPEPRLSSVSALRPLTSPLLLNKVSGGEEDDCQLPRDSLPILGPQQHFCHQNKGDKIYNRSGHLIILVIIILTIIIFSTQLFCPQSGDSRNKRLKRRGEGRWRECCQGGWTGWSSPPLASGFMRFIHDRIQGRDTILG